MASLLKPALFFGLGAVILLNMAQATWARDTPFDDEYTSCPSHLRLAPLTGVAVRHPEEDGDLRTDQLEVTWDVLPSAIWHQLGDRRYTAAITVIADGPGEPLVQHTALGSDSVLFENTALAADWEIWVAVTDQLYVISDITGPEAE